MRVITFKVEEEMLEKIDSIAKLKGVTRSEIIRKALELYVHLEEKKMLGQKEPKRVRLTS